ncbi:MAG: hypothetical protein COA47_09065 [Robiginitomaculum sp.]|nr:MAG: hypothetical protein COA47_09065 [Robiginitomaculum sp.]
MQTVIRIALAGEGDDMNVRNTGKILMFAGAFAALAIPAVANDTDVQLRPADGSIRSANTQAQNQWQQANANTSTSSSYNAGIAVSSYDAGSSKGDKLEFEAILRWDSEYIFRGAQQAKQNVSGGIEARYGSAYGGVWTVVPTPDGFNSYQTRIDVYAGYGFDISGAVYGDVGVNGYIRPDDGILFAQDDSIEAYAGITWDSELSPAIYGYYDFVLERFTIEASANYVVPFGRTDLVIGGAAGYSNGNGFDYSYFQADAELVHNFTRNTSIGLGGHWAVSTEPTFLDGLAITGDNTTWFGIRLRTGQ